MFEESGFKVTVLKEHHFRFCENPAYRKLCGHNLKEMDVAWWDNDKLCLLELKGKEIWNGLQENETALDRLVEKLRGKATDVLLMLAAAWVETKLGKQIKVHLPRPVHQYPGDGNIKLIFLIDTPYSSSSLLPPVKDALNRKLAGRANLFGIRRITLLDFERARNREELSGIKITRPDS